MTSETPPPRTARCACGQLTLTGEGEPAMQGLCSCLECQRATGSSVFHHGYWPEAAIRTRRGDARVWRRLADSGRWIDSHFCPVCGSGVFSFAEFAPGMVCIAIGCFADPGFPPPAYSVWERYRPVWLQPPEGCRRFDTQPPD